MSKPTVFVGSSREGLEIARAVQFQLKDDALVSVWNEGVFGLSQGTLESLVTMLDRFDFAVLIITPDDVRFSRKTTTQAPRDNVMFELGLFMGRLGRARTFGVCSSSRDLELPSDLAGVTLSRFDHDDASKDVTAALGPVCFQIRQAIRELGISETKKLSGIRITASQVEKLSDQIAHLVVLLARSRVLELDVISKQFGQVLPSDISKKIQKDLIDLEKATETKKYVDNRASYLGGHPKHEYTGRGKLTINDDQICFVSTDESVKLQIPKATVNHVYDQIQRLGIEQAAVDEDVLIGEHETLLRFTTVVNVIDSEGVCHEGFDIRFGFRNEYYAKVFCKKCSDKFSVPPF